MLNKDIEPKKLLDLIYKEDKNIQRENRKRWHFKLLRSKDIRTKDGKFKIIVYRMPNSISEIINNKCRTPYTFKIAALRVYINRAIVVCSTEKINERRNKNVKFLAEEIGCNNKIIKQLYEARIKK